MDRSIENSNLTDNAMEWRSLVSESLLAGAQGAEVLGRLGHHIRAQLHDDPAHGAPVGRDVHKHAGQRHFCGGTGEQSRTCSKIQRGEQTHSLFLPLLKYVFPAGKNAPVKQRRSGEKDCFLRNFSGRWRCGKPKGKPGVRWSTLKIFPKISDAPCLLRRKSPLFSLFPCLLSTALEKSKRAERKPRLRRMYKPIGRANGPAGRLYVLYQV